MKLAIAVASVLCFSALSAQADCTSAHSASRVKNEKQTTASAENMSQPTEQALLKKDAKSTTEDKVAVE